jgi:hypothetical protein
MTLLILLTCITVVACSDDVQREGREGVRIAVDTVAGVVQVRNDGAAPTWTLDPILSVGSLGDVGGADPDEFGRINSVLADDSGNVYVADGQAHEIKVFGSYGQYFRSIGREGSGPGELRSLYPMAWLGDTLAVLDPGNARIALFSRGGEWAGSWPWQPLTGQVRFISAGLHAAYAQSVRINPGGSGLDRIFVRYTAAGPTDSIPAPELSGAAESSVICHRPDGGISVFEVPFAPSPTFAFTADGQVALAPGAEYRIAFLTAAGDTTRIVEREHTPVPITDEEWEEEIRPYREFRSEASGARCEGEMQRPAAKPAIHYLLFDTRRRMWAEVSTPTGFRWDVFDREGKLLGTVPAPTRSESAPPYVRGDRLYIVAADSLDVQQVKGFRIVR